MKLYTREEFLRLPAGVVFAEYESCSFGAFQIKGDTLTYNDYREQNLVEINDDLYDEYFEACLDFEEKKTANVDFYDWRRNGLYESNQLYAVLEAHEVRGLVNRLQETLQEGYK